MSDQIFGPRRCRDARKPELNQCSGVEFYRCSGCGAVYFNVSSRPEPEERVLNCCGRSAEHLVAKDILEARKINGDLKLDYQIMGGYNDNSVKVSFCQAKPELKPEWIFLKTFTGGSIKYLTGNKRSCVVFALADTDAFAYCDEDPCLECTFRCKRGFVLYAYFPETGLVAMPLDKMSPYWQSERQENQ